MQKHFSTSIIALISIILFSVIASGGCSSSSSHNFSPNTNLQNANAIFSGTWSITSGTAQITMNGETDNLTIKDYDFHFSSCDLEDTEGTAALSSFTTMKGSMSGYISAFLDNENIITERNGNSWTFTMEGVKTLNMELVSETEANITGVMYLNDYVIDPDGNPIPCNVNIAMKKDTASTPALDVDSILPGLWQTVDSNGKYLESGGSIAYWGDAISVEEVFSSIIFESVDIAGDTADPTIYDTTYALYNGSDGDNKRAITIFSYPTKTKISNMFANVYKFESNIVNEEQAEFYAMKINDDNTATLIMHAIDQSPNKSDDVFPFEGHIVMSLHKKPDDMTVNLSDDMANSVWSAQDGNATFESFTSFTYGGFNTNEYYDEIEAGSLKLTINSVDVSDNSLNTTVLTGTLQRLMK